ncbi:MAG TPA: sialate O-acetylesterase [Burkholderiales bacterium]|nr:sialate O-acetylesterase [Burkholderiales bacterium]
MRGTPPLLYASVLALLFAFGLAARAEGPRPAIIFVLAGQSNMVGKGRIAELEPRLRRQPGNVEFYLGGALKAMSAQESAGPEFSLAHELSNAMPDRQIVLIKYALDGSSLLDWAPEWTAERAALTQMPQFGPLYRTLLYDIGTVVGNRPIELGAIFWMQGERDARFPAAAREYEANLRTLVGTLRRDLEDPDLPFIFGQVNPPPAAYLGVKMVRDAQSRLPRSLPDTRLVPTDDLTKLPDQLHYDTRGQVLLGQRFARTYIARQKRARAAEADYRSHLGHTALIGGP